MIQLKALLIKLMLGLFAFWVGLDWFFDATAADIIAFTAAVSAITFVIGDRILLTRFGNKNTIMIDFLLTYVSVWVFGSVLLESYLQIAWGSFISAFLVAGGEVIVHRIMLRSFHQDDLKIKSPIMGRTAFTMEIAEEEEPIKKTDLTDTK